jgi:hypothetical protein
MHVADIQERVRQLRDGIPQLDKGQADKNLSFLARQHQDAGAQFPSITDRAGQVFVLEHIKANKVDLVVLDNFSTLGEVEDENAAASFNAIQQFLLQLKVQGVATMLVHHTGKAEDNFRGSSKLAATFETIIHLARPELQRKSNGAFETRARPAEHGVATFRVCWDKVRAGTKARPRSVVARLASGQLGEFGAEGPADWQYEALGLDRLDEIAERVPAGEFMTQKEMAMFFDVSQTTIRNYLDRGLALRLWTEQALNRGFALGKKRRTEGRTSAPVAPDRSWRNEPLDDEPPGEKCYAF